jgi:hypothetical protein
VAGAHVFNFNDPAIDSDFEAKFDGLRRAKSWIIDLRYNSRGSSGIGCAIESHFVDAPVEGSKQSTLSSKTVVLCSVELGLRGGSEPACRSFIRIERSLRSALSFPSATSLTAQTLPAPTLPVLRMVHSGPTASISGKPRGFPRDEVNDLSVLRLGSNCAAQGIAQEFPGQRILRIE